jgi:hypothetical protein
MPIAKYAQQNLVPARPRRRSRGFGGGLWKPKPGQSFSENKPLELSESETEDSNPRIEAQVEVQS